MYDNAIRDFSVRTTTGPLVGPTTYVICDPRCEKQNPVPFASSKPRKSCFINKIECDNLYDTRPALEKKIKGGVSLKNREKRFAYKRDSETPCPTKYNTHLVGLKKPKLILDPTKPKIYACRVPHTLTVNPPSIPSKNEENGYDMDERGDIIKVPPTKHQSLDLDYQHLWSLDKGCRWSARNEPRFSNKVDQFHPAPNTYQVDKPACLKHEEDEKFREMARLFCFLPRYIEAKELQARHEMKPGPPTYNISKPWYVPEERGKSINPKPFICSSARFKSASGGLVGPNTYNIDDEATAKKRKFSIKCSAFGFDALRFSNKEPPPLPGPASYDIKGALLEKIQSKKNKFALSEPPFNKTAERELDPSPKDARCTPSSADYPLEDLTEEEDKIVRVKPLCASVFESAVPRFNLCPRKEGLGPSTYNFADSFDTSTRRKYYGDGMWPFNSSGPRTIFPKGRIGVPCSTTYETAGNLDESGQHFNLTPRFKDEEDRVGPTTYNIHQKWTDSFYPAVMTNNLSLKENVLGKKLRLAPKHTRNKWINLLKKRKLLKTFDVELDYEEKQMLLIEMIFSTPI